MKICVVGLGYVGLPLAVLFADNGYDVIGVDINQNVVNSVTEGNAPTHELGLEEKLKSAVNSGRLTAKIKPEKADVFILAVPTPITNKKQADLTFVKKAAESILPFIEKGNIIILESTVPPGTTEEVIGNLLKEKGIKDVFLAHCPERILPGNALKELVENSRIIGGTTAEASERVKDLYKSFVEGEIFVTDAKTAEFIKLMENTYRDVNIAFANELAVISKKIGVNIREAIEIANKHPRVNIHHPGPGVGGHCIAVDPWFIVEKAQDLAKIIALARETNDAMPSIVVDMITMLVKNIKNPTVTILGVAYKADIDDARETPAKKIVGLLKEKGYSIKVYDPHVKYFPYQLTENLEGALHDSDCIVLVTDHSAFKNLNPDEVKNILRTKNIVDTRSCLDKNLWKKAGFNIETI